MEQLNAWGITIPGIIVLAILLFGLIRGYLRGFIKEIFSVCCVILPLLIAWFAMPYAEGLVRENTPLYETVEEAVSDFIGDRLNTLPSGGISDPSAFFESLGLPKSLAESMEKNLPQQLQNAMNVNSLKSFVSGYLADTSVRAGAFVLAYIISGLILTLASVILNAVAHLPVLDGINRYAGALLGALKYLILFWILLLAITGLAATDVGQTLADWVRRDTILNWLDSNNALKPLLSILGL